MNYDKLTNKRKKISLRVPESLYDYFTKLSSNTGNDKQEILLDLLMVGFNVSIEELLGKQEYSEFINYVVERIKELDDANFIKCYINIIVENNKDVVIGEITKLLNSGIKSKVKSNNLSALLELKSDYLKQVVSDLRTEELRMRFKEVTQKMN